jgi:hypothetical protein
VRIISLVDIPEGSFELEEREICISNSLIGKGDWVQGNAEKNPLEGATLYFLCFNGVRVEDKY